MSCALPVCGNAAALDSPAASVNFPSRFALLARLAWVGGVLAHLLLPAAQANSWHSLEDIRATAVRFVTEHPQRAGNDTQAVAGEIDARLKLASCGQALEAWLPPGARVASRTTVGVRCTGPRPWKLFVPVRVSITARIVVAARPLAAGAVLTDADLGVAEHDISRQNRGYIRDGTSLVGQVLRRDLAEGEPLRANLLNAPTVVRRGQRVTIAAVGGPVRIRMAGTAMNDGRMGQRIQVKNRSSGRVVEGIVRSTELVEIGLK